MVDPTKPSRWAGGLVWTLKLGRCRCSVDSSEEVLASHGVGVHGALAGCPVGGANLIGVGFHMLERLQHTQGFLHVAAHRQVVDGGVLDHTLRVDDEQTAQGNAFGFVEDVVGTGNLLLEVSNQWIGDIAKACLLYTSPSPRD